MKLSLRSSIGGKLMMGFLVVVAMSVLIGGISYNQFRASEILVSDEVMAKAEARHLLSQMILKSTSVFGSVKDYLLAKRKSRKVALRIIIHDGIRTLKEYLRQMQSRNLTVEEREAFERIQYLFLTKYSDLTMKILKEYDKGVESKKEIEQVVDEFRDVYFRFVTILQNFNSIETKTMYDSWDFAQRKIFMTKFLVLGLSVVALILGIFFGIISTRMITVPVHRLVKTLEVYASGNFDARADLDRQDEIGFLGERFNIMLERIKADAAELRQINQELESRNVELDQSREQLQILTDTIPDAVYICTPEGGIVSANLTCLEMFEYLPEDIFPRNARQLNGEGSSEAVIGEKFAQALEGDSPGFEWLCKKKSGVEFPVVARFRKMQIGEDNFILSVLTDITEQKRAGEEKERLEAQLLHAQKMEAVGTLAGGIAHDFNNVLQAIGGYVELLLMKKEEDDPDYNYLSQISRLTHRAGELVKQLLIFSSKVESKLRPVDLNQEVVNIFRVLGKTIPKMVDIELALTDEIKIINADPIQLEQIIMNLAVNARDAMPDGGKLIIKTESVVLDKRYCRTHLGLIPGEYVSLIVSDTGSGMDKQTLEHIFEPFFTSKPAGRGTGLGLSIVYGIVSSHGGHITCYSEPGQGASFKIYFPVLEVEVESGVEGRVEDLDIRGGDETILLVDDEKGILDIGSEILKQYGYTALTAGSGESAIEVYKSKKDRVDLVVLDLGMPGMGGYRCLEELLKIEPALKVIIASGYSLDGQAKEKLESGAAGFVSKPYQLVELLKKVREILDV